MTTEWLMGLLMRRLDWLPVIELGLPSNIAKGGSPSVAMRRSGIAVPLGFRWTCCTPRTRQGTVQEDRPLVLSNLQPQPVLRANRAAIGMMLQGSLNHCPERLVGQARVWQAHCAPIHGLPIGEPHNGYGAWRTHAAGDVNMQLLHATRIRRTAPKETVKP